jgi:hypothetical protein
MIHVLNVVYGFKVTGCLALEARTKRAKPFVGCVMKRLHNLVLQYLKEIIALEFGSVEDMESLGLQY